MKSVLWFLFFLLDVVVWAHPLEKSDSDILNTDFSLSDLVQVSKLPSTWTTSDATRLEEGRILLTPKTNTKGSLWHKQNYKLGEDLTIEWTFRSVNFLGKSEGGMAFWFIDSKSGKDVQLFNGPSKYDGLQILIENNGVLGSNLRAQLNDGSEKFSKENIYDKSFGSCLLAYQDSSVPLNVRLTYSARDNNILKLQVDNKVCFQTRKVKLPAGNYRIGVTAENANTPESFEILKLQVYDGVTEDSLIPNVKAMDQPKLITKVVDQKTGKEELVEKSSLELSNEAGTIDNYKIYEKLDKLEGKVLANDISELSKELEALALLEKQNSKKLDELTAILKSVISVIGSDKEGSVNMDSFQDFIKMDEKLEQLLKEQERVREATKNSILYAANGSGPHPDDIVAKLTMWLIPLVVIMMVMAYYTFKIRQDIVKTKLL